jgi:uncharacterized membrane protein YbaN (DUF454 family)
MLLKIVGIFFVALAILGVVLPILPTTPFLLVSAACFAKSSPKMYKMLLENKIFGPLIYHWQASRSLPRSAKLIALTSIVLASSWSCYLLDNNILRIVIIALVTGPLVFLWRLPISDGNKQT